MTDKLTQGELARLVSANTRHTAPATEGGLEDGLLEALRAHAAESERRAEAAEAKVAELEAWRVSLNKTAERRGERYRVAEAALSDIHGRIAADFTDDAGVPDNALSAVEFVLNALTGAGNAVMAEIELRDQLEAALAQEREAHKALRDAARAVVDDAEQGKIWMPDSFGTDWMMIVERNKLDALRDALAALPGGEGEDHDAE